ncbi:MAG: CorA family divalent cation transporter [Desulfitobacteriaceae bacterium]|nr:CorA family divalent cation transporter [Clostridia bacterium]MDD4345497.1 CorA family divalent cation transporter [Desulfitobacteriaceae bacterium]MDD4400642.1 CorA family divalent cation transporter [Desulfitobacteriaceae bacterium]
MESFIIYPNGIKRSETDLTSGQSLLPDNFRLFIISEQELDLVPRIISLEINLLMDLLTCSPLNYPQLKRLGTAAYLVFFRDLNSQGEELTIRFLLTETELIMLGWNEITFEKITVWARSGIIGTPFNLAQALGARVLRHYLIQLEKIEDLIDCLEEEIMKEPNSTHQAGIVLLQKQVIGLKRSLNLNLYVFNRLVTIVPPNVLASCQELVQDTERELENARQALELVENLRETYQAAIGNRSNEIMKWLTLLATILLPINLLTSFFGMNFQLMPLLHLSYGITIFYVVCIVFVTVVLVLFWRKKWFHK